MPKQKSSKIFYIQRWWKSFRLSSSPNRTVDQVCKPENPLFTVRNFPCLARLKVKDAAQDTIRITIEIIKEDATKAKYGPIYGGKYFKNTKK